MNHLHNNNNTGDRQQPRLCALHCTSKSTTVSSELPLLARVPPWIFLHLGSISISISGSGSSSSSGRKRCVACRESQGQQRCVTLTRRDDVSTSREKILTGRAALAPWTFLPGAGGDADAHLEGAATRRAVSRQCARAYMGTPRHARAGVQSIQPGRTGAGAGAVPLPICRARARAPWRGVGQRAALARARQSAACA
uniref:Uncharacterized protein n=1 Tax=Oryza meridionalis TaxID=40149 RepID=A0A0E0CC37_9ORYZ